MMMLRYRPIVDARGKVCIFISKMVTRYLHPSPDFNRCTMFFLPIKNTTSYDGNHLRLSNGYQSKRVLSQFRTGTSIAKSTVFVEPWYSYGCEIFMYKHQRVIKQDCSNLISLSYRRRTNWITLYFREKIIILQHLLGNCMYLLIYRWWKSVQFTCSWLCGITLGLPPPQALSLSGIGKHIQPRKTQKF